MRKKMVVCTFGLFAILLLPAAADEGLSSPPRRLNAVGEGMPSPPRRLNEFKVKYVFTNLIPIGHVHLRLIIASRDAAKQRRYWSDTLGRTTTILPFPTSEFACMEYTYYP